MKVDCLNNTSIELRLIDSIHSQELPWCSKYGSYIDYSLLRVTEELGIEDPLVRSALSDKLRVPESLILTRLEHLRHRDSAKRRFDAK